MEISAAVVKALTNGGSVVGVYHHAGHPGGHNNDRVVLTMETGERVSFDSYSGGGMHVSLANPAKENKCD